MKFYNSQKTSLPKALKTFSCYWNWYPLWLARNFDQWTIMREIGRGVLTAPVYRSGHCRTIPQGVATDTILFSWLFVKKTWPFPCGFPKIEISQKSGFHAFLGISGRFYGDFSMGAHSEIQIFWLKSQFLREIPKKPRNPDFSEHQYTTWEGLWRVFHHKNLPLVVGRC